MTNDIGIFVEAQPAKKCIAVPLKILSGTLKLSPITWRIVHTTFEAFEAPKALLVPSAGRGPKDWCVWTREVRGPVLRGGRLHKLSPGSHLQVVLKSIDNFP